MQPMSSSNDIPQDGAAIASPLSTATLAPSSPGSSPYAVAGRPARTLVLCFDGTGDSFDADVRPHDAVLSCVILTFLASELERSRLVQYAQERRPERADGLLSGSSFGSRMIIGNRC